MRYPWLAVTIGAPPAAGDLGLLRREGPMASLSSGPRTPPKAPEGKKLTEEVKEQASKPENRRKIKEFGQRFMKKR